MHYGTVGSLNTSCADCCCWGTSIRHYPHLATVAHTWVIFKDGGENGQTWSAVLHR